MASLKQLEANQKNALKSTGPKTATGLQVVSQNAIKHGIFTSQPILLPGEDPKAYAQFKNQFYQDFQATTQAERLLIDKMAQATWKKQRLYLLEQRLIAYQQEEQACFSAMKQQQNFDSPFVSKLKGEIEALKDEQESIEDCIKECLKFNRMRNSAKREEEAKCLRFYLSECLKELQEHLISYLAFDALSDARKSFPQTIEGRYARMIITQSVFHNEKETLKHPVYTGGLERLVETIRQRILTLETRLQIIQQKQGLELAKAEMGLDLLPNEGSLAKIQRYEAYLDSQFYKALRELQKLQAFILQKQNFRSPKNGFVL